MNKIPYMITDSAITVFIDNKGFTVNKGDTRYLSVKDAIRSGDFDIIPKLLDLKGTMVAEGNGDLYILNGVLKYKNDVVEPMLGGRIIAMRQEGYDITPYVLFMENLNENPTPTAKKELYGFIENSNLPITEDGHFLAYKMVRNDFTDIYSGVMDNSIGTVVEMYRENVDADRTRTCSSGLHFCSEGYLGSYGSRHASQVVILKINPRDVVSIPTDYNNAKGRACKYTVMSAIGWDELIKADFSDEFKEEPADEPEVRGVDATHANTDLDYRWELRNSDEATLISTWVTRSDARNNRGDNEFIWDNLNTVVISGRTNPEFDFTDLDGFADSDPDTDDTDDIVEKDRWEIRDSFTGKFKLSFNSRKYAREYRKSDEFIWDNVNEVKINGTVDPKIDLDNLTD